MAANQKTAQVLKNGDAQIASADFSGRTRRSSTDSLVAFAGGGQANGTALPSDLNRVITVATAGDSVKLPVSEAGLELVVVNAAGANSMNVFPQTGDAINALAANAAFAVAAGKTAIFTCHTAGRWHSTLSA